MGKPVQVDFSDTESRGGKKGAGGRVHLPPGDYAAKCVAAKFDKSSEKETPGLYVTYKITNGKASGKQIVDRLWLTPKSLWRVRQTLEAMGMKVPSKRVSIDPDKLKGKAVAITLDDEEYEGKLYSRVTDTFLLSELEAVETDEEDTDLGTDEDEEEDEETETEEETEEDLEDVDLDDI